jgi:ribosomal protein S18 acetylase RimI-like enzyme
MPCNCAAPMMDTPLVPTGKVGAMRKFRDEDTEATARLLARAFADNPCYAFMHPRASTRAADLERFFRRNLAWRASLGLSWVACSDSGDVVATATLEPPGGVPRSLRSVLTHWVVPTARDHGLRAVARLAWADAEFARHNRRVAGRDAYWHVHAVAVDPGAQGHGTGTALMRYVLHALDALRAQRPAPVVLSTQRERNVGFYRRLGFEPMRRVTMGRVAPGAEFTSWFMRLPDPPL